MYTGSTWIQTTGKVRFLEVSAGGFLGIGKKHYLVPIEAVDDETPGAVHVDQSAEKLQASPAFDPEGEIDDDLQRAVYEHYGYPAYDAGRQQPT